MFNLKGSEDEEDFYFTYPPMENPDWDYGRNRFFMLKRAQGCWSSSLYSVKFRDFLMPNRDYPEQGLLCKTDEGYVKFLDALGFKLQGEEGVVDLEPTKVKISPWKAVYYYRNEDLVLKVEYYLARTQWNNKLGGWVKFNLENGKGENLNLKVFPLVDIRNLNENSNGEYEFEEKGNTVKISRNGKEMLIGPVENVNQYTDSVTWNYKLGNGERKVEDGKVLFKTREAEPRIFGEMDLDLDGEVKVGLLCGNDVTEGELELVLMKSDKEDERRAQTLLDKVSTPGEGLLQRFFKARILSLSNFGTWENNLKIPEAGEWWFKEIWFRDLFESILHNIDFYRKVKGDEWLKKVFRWTRMFLENGTLPNKVDKVEQKNSSLDATFLYLLCMAKFYEKSEDEKFGKMLSRVFEAVINHFGEESLIRCKANHSWMDTKWNGRPTRIPEDWDVNDRGEFLLPEINALWIRVLEKYKSITEADVKIERFWNEYRETFWNEDKDLPYQIVYRNGDKELKDPTASSVGIVSMALLLDHFFGDEILGAWKTIKKQLLVKRTPVFFEKEKKPFGVLVKNTDERIYLDDRQYQEAVIWPRDLPYLFKILRKLGKDEIIKQIGMNLLDHQMSEGAIGYNQELFSLPEGENPSQMALSENPVPVKNPVQLWSHFVNPVKIGSK